MRLPSTSLLNVSWIIQQGCLLLSALVNVLSLSHSARVCSRHPVWFLESTYQHHCLQSSFILFPGVLTVNNKGIQFSIFPSSDFLLSQMLSLKNDREYPDVFCFSYCGASRSFQLSVVDGGTGCLEQTLILFLIMDEKYFLIIYFYEKIFNHLFMRNGNVKSF